MSVIPPSKARRAISFLFGLLLIGLAPSNDRAEARAPEAKPDPAQLEFFESKVRPILVEKCQSCHGESKPKGGLKLTARSHLLAGGSSGPAAVAGKPDESLLVEAVRYRDEPKMPPKEKLADTEIGILEKWIAMGLPWPDSKARGETASTSAPATSPETIFSEEQRKFWSFQPIGDPKPPAVKDSAWIKSDIDRFILAELEKKGLNPALPADKRTFMRRATFDLTGLPPIPEEVEAFVNDTKDDAYARLIDRLLASPAYGERWSRYWLDVVRYADALDSRGAGGVGDILDAWRYRDWVVDALNNDLPYDRFVRAQIAGDVLSSDDPNERKAGFNRSGTIATTMLAIGNWGNGDADKDKILTDIADDQVDVVSKAFLGITMACARCHDHKFDPISQRDYYGMAGIFFSTHILPKLTPKGAGETIIRIPLASPTEIARREKREARMAALDKQIRETSASRYASLSESLRSQAHRYVLAAWEFSRKPEAERTPEKLNQFAAGKKLQAFGVRQWMEALGLGDRTPLLRKSENLGGVEGVFAWMSDDPSGSPSVTANTRAEVAKIATFTLPPRSVSVHPGPASGVILAWKSPITGKVRVSGKVADGDPQGGDGVAWSLGHRSDRRGPHELAAGNLANASAEPSKIAVTEVDTSAGDVIQLVILPRAEYTCDTTNIELEIATVDGSKTWNLARDVVGSFLTANPHPDQYGHTGVWRFEDMRGNYHPPAVNAPGNAPIAGLFREMVSKWGTPEAESAATRFVAEFRPKATVDPFLIRSPADESALPSQDREELAKLRAELDGLRREPAPAMEFANAAAEGGVPESPHAGTHDVKVHLRGRYDRLGDLVPRRFPVILAGMPDKQAKITQGSGRKELAEWLTSPEHPLTSRVIVNRVWQHHFGEGIVRSPSNFGKLGERPSHPELLDFLARSFVKDGWSLKTLHRRIMLSSVYRQSSVPNARSLEADPDNRLFGRMNRRRLDAESLRDSLLSVSGRLDPTRSGPPVRDLNQPRRSLYVMSIRSDRSSFMTLFDQADSTAPADRRINSTVAPQALYLLNNAFVIEQAKSLAARLGKEAPGDESSRIKRAYELLYGRPPVADEAAIGLAALRAGRDSGESSDATWLAYCQILLCANEFIYVD